MRIDGACHCGNITFELETQASRAAIEPRACDCSFCTRHGAQTWSDPAGRVELVIRDETLLQRYRFGPATADFLVCRRCGAYAAAAIVDGAPTRGEGESMRATVNLRLTDLHALPASSVSYASETRAERIARRHARWTPATLTILPTTLAPTPRAD